MDYKYSINIINYHKIPSVHLDHADPNLFLFENRPKIKMDHLILDSKTWDFQI